MVGTLELIQWRDKGDKEDVYEVSFTHSLFNPLRTLTEW